MKDLRSLFVLSVALFMLTLSGCAGYLPKADELPSLKGSSSAEIVKMFGEPDRKFSDSKSRTVWEYKRPSQKQKAFNTVSAIGSFGLFGGDRATYVDITTFTFSNDKVVGVSCDENVINPNFTGGIDVKSLVITQKGNDREPETAVETKQTIKKAVAATKEESAPVGNQQSDLFFKIQTTKTVHGNTASVHKKLLAFAKERGIEVEKKKNGFLVFKCPEGKITTSFKQSKKSVKVDMTANVSSTTTLEEMNKALN